MRTIQLVWQHQPTTRGIFHLAAMNLAISRALLVQVKDASWLETAFSGRPADVAVFGRNPPGFTPRR